MKTLVTGLTPDGRYAYLFDTDGDDDVSDETVRYFEADSTVTAATAVRTDYYVDENTLSVNVNRLRKKLESIGCEKYIETIKGMGYKV